MKKQLFWLAMGAVALSGCTDTEVIDESKEQGNVIGFDNVIRKTTRAAIGDGEDLTQKDFDQFFVYAYYTKQDDQNNEMAPVKLFDGDRVYKKTDGEGNTSWVYDITQYWIPQATYNFYAFSCADTDLESDTKGSASFDVPATVQEGQSKLDARGFRINNYYCDATHQHDLICAAVEQQIGQASNNDKVKFSFRHALCKVTASFVNDFPGGYTMTISDVKLRNFYNRANLNVRGLKDAITLPSNPSEADMKNLQEGIWSSPARIVPEDEDPTVEEVTEIGLDITDNTTNAVFMLPVYYDNANLQIEFTITLAQGDNVIDTRTLRGTWKPVWIPGRAYKYSIHINGDNAKYEPIVFQTSQDIDTTDDWGSDITTDISFGQIK